MKVPRISAAGTDAVVVHITGDPRNAEPIHTRIVFPGGEVEVVRAKDGVDADYWVHLVVNHPASAVTVGGDVQVAKVTDARLDIRGRHTTRGDEGRLRDPDLYHLALRVTR